MTPNRSGPFFLMAAYLIVAMNQNLHTDSTTEAQQSMPPYRSITIEWRADVELLNQKVMRINIFLYV